MFYYVYILNSVHHHKFYIGFTTDLIKSVLESENFSLNDVVSLTVYLTDKSMLPEFDKAFKEYFYDIKPTCTLVGISWLVKDDLLIEVETLAEK